MTSRPRSPFQRRTAKRAAFRETGMPSAATTREGILLKEFFVAEGLLLLRPHAGSPAHAAHTLSSGLRECFVGHCEEPRRSHLRQIRGSPPAGGSRVQTPF
jgi:hypothetical protein